MAVYREIAHVSGEPMEPTHMLLKLVVAGEESIPKAVLAHIYLVGWVPKARYDTATVSWKETDDLAEHEIWAMREAQILRMDSIVLCISSLFSFTRSLGISRRGNCGVKS